MSAKRATLGWTLIFVLVSSAIASFQPQDAEASIRSGTPSPSPILPSDLYLGGGSLPLVTPSQASQILAAWWPLHELALADNNIRLSDMLEAGPSREYDDAVSRDNIIRGGNLRVARHYTDSRVLVPWLAQFPAYFLAEVATTVYGTSSDYAPGTPYTEVLVFSRASKQGPWMVMLRTGHTNSAFDEVTPFMQGSEAFDSAAPRPNWISPVSVPLDLADYWNQCYSNGPPAHPPFVQGYWTSQRCPQLQSDRLTALRQGIKTNGNYYASLKQDGFWEFNVYGGWDFACFTLRLDRQQRAINGVLLQNKSRSHYGGWLAPGTYSEITTSTLRQSCALIPPTPRGTPEFPGIGIVGGEGGIVGVEGINSAAPIQAPPTPWLRLAGIVLLTIYAAVTIVALIAILIVTRRRKQPAA